MHDFLQLVVHMLQYGFRRALAAMVVCLLPLGIAYVLCRKKGRVFPWGKAVAFVMLAGYGAVLLYVTLLRQVGLGQQVNLYLFRAWREAWNTFSLQNWLNVLLNIGLFVPLGALLPLLAGAFRKWYAALAAGFGTTLAIESAQYVLGRGMFDVDDLFTNTLGAMLGWCVVMTAVKWREGKWRPYVALPAAFCLLLGGIFGGYQLKEYGNLPEAPAFAARLGQVEWVVEPLEEGPKTAPIYWAEPFTKESGDAFGAEFAHRAGVVFPDAYYYDNLTMFANHSTGDFLNLWYHDRSYEFTASGSFDRSGAEGEEGRLRELLAGYGIDLPAEAVFAYEGNGWHTFTADFLPQGETVLQGVLRCKHLEDGSIGEIENTLVALAPYGEEPVISVEKALGELKRGNFQGGEMFALNQVRRVEILSCTLTYRSDTKGFYQPVYAFLVRLDGMGEGTVLIPAMG